VRGRRYLIAIACMFVASTVLADIRNAAPVQGGAHYAVPFVAVYALGCFGLAAMLFAFTCPKYTRPILLAGGTMSIVGQYVTILVDFEQYGDAFTWYDGFLLPAYCVFLPEAYSQWEHVVGLVFPCALIVLSTAVIPIAWAYYAWSLGRTVPGR
jgi:hypothetical protein